MIFEANLGKDETSSKPTIKLTSKAFDVVTNISAATHLKIKGTNEFKEISDSLVIKRKKDSLGNATDDVIHYSEITMSKGGKEEYVCIIDGNEVAIDSTFYAQIVFMNQAENGDYLRCDGDEGIYIHKSEIQIPAYKKLKLNEKTVLEVEPVHNREFYVQTQVIILPNGDEITLNSDDDITLLNGDKVVHEDDKWYYIAGNSSKKEECVYKNAIDSRIFVKYILLDNNKIVNIQKFEEQPNGKYVLKDVDGEDIEVGRKEVVLKQPFVTGSTMSVAQSLKIPSNILKQRPRIDQGNVDLKFVWKAPDENGLERVVVSRFKNKVTFFYADGTKAIYAKHDVVVNNLNPGDKVYRIQGFNIEDLGQEGLNIYFLDMKETIAENVVFDQNQKLTSCTMNGRNITNIKWHEVGGYDEISSYTIDGTVISDIEWSANQVKSCKVHLINENGEEKIVEVSNLRASEYAYLAISRKIENKIENVKIEDKKVSFKMGDYKFTDAEWRGDGTIGRCKLRHDGKEVEINLSEDERFSQLSLMVQVSLDEQRITPLIQSQLLEKKNGEYHLVADVVQTEEMKESKDAVTGQIKRGEGVAKATEVINLEHALKEQSNFAKKPFKTFIIDSQNKNKSHTLSDFETTYEGADEFEHSDDILIDAIGKNKIEVKKGEAQLDSKKDGERRDNTILLGLILCSNPFTIAFGVPMVIAGSIYGIVAPIIRGIKKARIVNKNIKKVKQTMQDNSAKHCQENINKLVASYQRELKAYKKLYSQKEFEQKSKELRERFRFEYNKEIGKLQLLGGGSLKCEFDANKKTKLTKDNYLAYLEYLRIRKEKIVGKSDSYEFKAKQKEFKKQKFSSREDKIREKIKLYTEYGGAKYQKRAQALKMRNIKLLLNDENTRRLKNEQKGISLEYYKKQLKREYNESRLTWGGINDKIKSFKRTPEYMRADLRTKKQLLIEKRASLEGELKKIKVESVPFNERLDKRGRPVVEKATQSAVIYREYVDLALASGNTRGLKSFSLNFADTLNDEDKKKYSPAVSLSDGTARKINNTTNRRLEHDQERRLRVIEKLETLQKGLNRKVENFSKEVKENIQTSNYEDLVRLQLEKDSKIIQLDKAYSKSQELVETIPFKELEESAIKRIKKTGYDGRASISKVVIQIQQAKESAEVEYNRQVGIWARDEFVKQHKNEFRKYARDVRAHVKDGHTLSLETQKQNFVTYMKNTSDRQEVDNELETYEVKHHIEDNVAAEVFCEMYHDDYNAFIEEQNGKLAQPLDPDSEIARCCYYAYCKREKTAAQMEEFKKYSKNKRKAKAMERLEKGTLTKHEQKQEKEQKTSIHSQIRDTLKSAKSSTSFAPSTSSATSGLAV